MILSKQTLLIAFLLSLAGCASSPYFFRDPPKNFRVRAADEALATWQAKPVSDLMRVYGPPDTLIKSLDSSILIARYIRGTSNLDVTHMGGGVAHSLGRRTLIYNSGQSSQYRSYDSLTLVDFIIDRASNTITSARYEGQPKVYWYPSNEKVNVTASGMGYVDLEVGTGRQPVKGDRVVIHFTGMLSDSSIFDSSILPEFEQTDPYQFVLGNREVILGWEEAVSSMRLGGRRKVVLPSHLGYGRDGYKDVIGPNETLIYYLHLVDIQ